MQHDRSGSEGAILELAGRIGDRLVRLAFMILRNRQAAEDVAQETLARAIEHCDELRGDPSAWMYAITINLCRGRLRDERPASVVDPDALDRLATPGEGPAEAAIRDERRRRTADALEGLDPAMREVFVLHYVEGLPYDEVARICGVSEGASRLRAMRARQMLRHELAPLLDADVRRRVDESTVMRRPDEGRQAG